MAGRERQWDIELNGLPLRLLRRPDGLPKWEVEPIPAVAGQAVVMSEEERRWTTYHSGFGYSHYLAPDTYHYCTNLDPVRPRQVLMGPEVTSITVGGTAAINGFFEQSGALYVLAGQYCKKINQSTNVCVTIDGGDGSTGMDFTAGKVATAAANFDGSTVVLLGESTNGYTFEGTTWTQMNTTSIQGTYMATLWADTYYALARSTTNGSDLTVTWMSEGTTVDLAASWGSYYPIGENGHAITGMAASDQTVFVGKTDGLYYVDRTGRTPRVVPVYQVNANNGKNLFVDSAGRVWFPTDEGLLLYDRHTGNVFEVTPGRGLGNDSAIYGRITALCQYKGWVYAAVYNGTDSYICVAREREPNEPGLGPVVWHGALVKVTSGSVGAMFVTGLVSPPRLYYGVSVGSVHDCAFIRLPTQADNPAVDSNYRFAASGSLYLPADEWNVPGTRWSLQGCIIEAEGLGSTTYITVYADLDNGGYRYIGRASLSGRVFLTMDESDDWRFSRCAFRLDFTNGANTSTPKLRSFVARAARRVAARDLISTVTYCSTRARSRYQIPTRLSGQSQLTAIKACHLLGPVSLKDWWTGELRTRRVLVMPVRETLIREQGDQDVDQGAIVTMAVVSGEESSGTSVETPSTTAIYGAAVYGTDRYS